MTLEEYTKNIDEIFTEAKVVVDEIDKDNKDNTEKTEA